MYLFLENLGFCLDRQSPPIQFHLRRERVCFRIITPHLGPDSFTMADDSPVLLPYPLYQTTLTLHRLSPLYTPHLFLSDSALASHARRFHDILKGEVLRGVRVGLSSSNDEGLARSGALIGCTWRILGSADDWMEEQRAIQKGEGEGFTVKDRGGVYIDVSYERAHYAAILLSTPERLSSYSQDPANKDFTYLPLLLVRMPGPLRDTLISYLNSTFDTRISSLLIPTFSLFSSLEQYITDLQSLTSNSAAAAQQILTTVLRDITLTLSFPTAMPSLRTLDITISRDDFPRLLSHGAALCQGSTTGKVRDGAHASAGGPLSSAISAYVKQHLALELGPAARVSKVACGAFVLGGEGKVKIIVPKAEEGGEGWDVATRRFLEGLVEMAVVERLVS